MGKATPPASVCGGKKCPGKSLLALEETDVGQIGLASPPRPRRNRRRADRLGRLHLAERTSPPKKEAGRGFISG